MSYALRTFWTLELPMIKVKNLYLKNQKENTYNAKLHPYILYFHNTS